MTATAAVALILGIAVGVLIVIVLRLLSEVTELSARLDTTRFILDRLMETERRASARPTSSLLSRPLRGPTFQGGNADAVDK